MGQPFIRIFYPRTDSMDGGWVPTPSGIQILWRVDVQCRGRKIHQHALRERQFADHFAKSTVTRNLERSRVQPARQNERHAA
jgi:hypothetical protein